MGKQVLSTVQTATSAFRTTSEREKWGKPYISAAHMQVSFADWQLHDGTPDLNWRLQDVAGVDSPGPAYEVTTTKKGASMLGSSKGGTTMGTAPRDLDLKVGGSLNGTQCHADSPQSFPGVCLTIETDGNSDPDTVLRC